MAPLCPCCFITSPACWLARRHKSILKTGGASGKQAQMGKTVGDDFREGKITLPVVLAYRRGNAEERAFWKLTLVDGEQSAVDLERALKLMASHSAIEDTVERTRHYALIARRGSSARCALLHLSGFGHKRGGTMTRDRRWYVAV